MLHRVVTLLAIVTLFALCATIVLLDPRPDGFVDIHIPAGTLGPAADRMPQAGAHAIGGGIARLQAGLAMLLFPVTLVLQILLLVAVVRRRKSWTVRLLPLALGFGVLGQTVPPPFGPADTRALATTPAAARNMLGLGDHSGLARPLPSGTGGQDAARRYVLAQIAYVEGDRRVATQLATGISADELGSPIEAPFRLHYLQSGAPALSTICFMSSGCLTQERRRAWQLAAILTGSGALAGLLACLFALSAIVGHARRIDHLRGIAADRAEPVA